MVSAKIAPSMLSCDFARLAEEAERMVRDGADWLHMDVMDGHFVPNLTLGAPIVKALRQHTKAFLDCHLMVSNPEQWVDDFKKAGADQFTFHIEATENAPDLVKKVKGLGMRCGVAIKPKTSIDAVAGILTGPEESRPDMILVMTVEPGFGGQSFMPDMMPKVRELRQQYPNMDIEVDGGLGPSNIDEAAAAGANAIVAGSSVFGSKSPSETISLLRQSVEKHTA